MIVTTFRVGRIYGGGGADIGWATSLNGGIAWTNGYLPGLTQWRQGGTNSADNLAEGDVLYMSTSTDGGLTWGTPKRTANVDYGMGGNPVVQPNGNVIVPFADFSGDISAFMSTNGGQSWTGPVQISTAQPRAGGRAARFWSAIGGRRWRWHGIRGLGGLPVRKRLLGQ